MQCSRRRSMVLGEPGAGESDDQLGSIPDDLGSRAARRVTGLGGVGRRRQQRRSAGFRTGTRRRATGWHCNPSIRRAMAARDCLERWDEALLYRTMRRYGGTADDADVDELRWTGPRPEFQAWSGTK